MGWLGGLLGGVASGAMNLVATEMTNKQNEKLTKKQWAREDNAHQREVVDLKAAGINPLLGAGGSGAASSPAARMESPDIPDFSGIAASKKQIEMQEKMNLNSMKNDNNITTATVAKLNADENLSRVQGLQALHDYNVYLRRNTSSRDSGPVTHIIQGLDAIGLNNPLNRENPDPGKPGIVKLAEGVEDAKKKMGDKGWIPEIKYDKYKQPNYYFNSGRYIKNIYFGKKPLFYKD